VLVTNASLNLIAKAPIASPFVMQAAMYANADLSNGRIACAGMNNLVDIYDISEVKPVFMRSFEGHEGYISQIHFLEEGTKLLTGSGDGSVILWDLTKMCMVQQWWGHSEDVSGVGLDTPDSKIFGTSSTDKTVRIWDMRAKTAKRIFYAKYANNCAAMFPDSKGIVVGCDNASYEFFSVDCNAQVARGKVNKGRCESACVSPSGRICYLGWDTGTMLAADMFNPQYRKEMEAGVEKNHTASVCSLSTAPDGSAILSSSFDRTAKVWGAPSQP